MATRTAVVAGTATAVSGRVQRRQYDRWAAQDAQYYQEPAPAAAATAAAAPAASAGGENRVAQLKDLADLKAQGILTDEEFAAEKARILGQ